MVLLCPKSAGKWHHNSQSRSDNASLLLYYYTLSRMRHTFWEFVLLDNVAGLGSH